jgi:two-component system cell cycle response regulator DivK
MTSSSDESAENQRGLLTPAQAHVIIVEDNADNLLVVMKLLKMIGIERINWRTTGWQVVQFVQTLSQVNMEGRPDLILLDIGLPREDGYQVLAALRADPLLHNTRVVAVTVRSAPIEMSRARAAGFDGFIGKPIDPLRFPDQIKRLLAGESVWEPG